MPPALRWSRLECQRLSGNGVLQFQTIRMQRDASPPGPRDDQARTIQPIAGNGTAASRQLRSQLVPTAGFRVQLDERRFSCPSHHASPSEGQLAFTRGEITTLPG